MTILYFPNIISTDYLSLLSLELGRPSLIKEEDCNVSVPSAVDDQYIHPGNNWLFPTREQSTSLLLSTIQVTGGIAKLLRMLKSRSLSATALEAYDSHFEGCLQEFPVYQQIRRHQCVDPIELPPIIYLQNARLMLYRHNLAPTSTIEERSAAVDQCASVAVVTARLLRLCMLEKPPDSQSSPGEAGSSWKERMVAAASAFLCTHIWRCTLFLSFRSDFENAIWCAQASATLGASRPINVACGRYLQFFLEEMLVKMNEGTQLQTDEEMIAYVSGDLQGSFENSWVWKGSKGDVRLENTFQRGQPIGNEDITPTSDLRLGNEWANVLSMLDHLFHEKQREEQQRVIKESSLRPPLMLPPLAPSPDPAHPSNRMSIKDLI